MKINFNTLLIILTLFLIAVITAIAINQAFYTVPSEGTIKTIGITADIESIHWGFMEPSQNKSSPNFTVTNNGTLPVILSMTTGNWTPPECESFFTCNWNLEGASLEAGENATAIVWLYVDAGIENVTSFSYDMILIGTETT